MDVAGYIHADNSIFSDGSINSLSNISANGYVNAIGGLYSSTSGTIATNFYVGGNITTGASSDATIGNNLNVGQNILVGTDGTDRGILSNYTSSPGSQLKFHMTDFTFTAILGPHAISAETSIAWTNGIFTSQPAVTVAQVTSTGGTTGQLYMVNLQLYNCDTNSCNARLVNLSSGNVNYSVTYRVQMIGY